MDKKEVLSKHFATNRRLGDRFSETLPGIQADLSRQTAVITSELSHMDRLLSAAQQKIQELAAGCKRSGIIGG